MWTRAATPGDASLEVCVASRPGVRWFLVLPPDAPRRPKETIMIRERRQIIKTLGLGAAMLTVPGAFAETLRRTATTGDGPFYPDRLPLDTDNDLLIINDHLTPAVGEITHLTGRLLAENGAPVRNAVIEIWQADMNGSYIHTGGRYEGKLDGNFQGYGRFLTDAER